MKNYNYPIDLDWSTAEIICVTEFLAMVEKANEQKVNQEQFLKAYQAFKTVVPSIAEEKRIGREFEKNSGYSVYRTVQAAKSSEKKEFIL